MLLNGAFHPVLHAAVDLPVRTQVDVLLPIAQKVARLLVHTLP